VKNEEVSQRVKEEMNILHTINRRMGNWIGHILCRKCLPTALTKERQKTETSKET
jgi:hypothetical protein